MSGHDEVVVVECAKHVMTIRLNRPEARNAINSAVAAALGQAIERLTSDDDMRVGIITGTGAAFCAGQDLKAFAAGEPVIPRENPQWGFASFVSHFTPKPLIAALNGYALGGGLEIALACDLIVAAEGASLGLPEVSRGLFPAGGGVPRLAQQIPPRIASRMVLTGEAITAEEAAHWGLVNKVVPAEDVYAEARSLAETIARNAPLGVQGSKRIVAEAEFDSTWGRASWAPILREFDVVFGSEDAAEGARAFVEKREPSWTGR